MAAVMLDVVDGRRAHAVTGEVSRDLVPDGEVIAHHPRRLGQQGAEPLRPTAEPGAEMPMDDAERLLVETHGIDVARIDSRQVETGIDRKTRERRVVFDPRQSFLLDRRHQFTVADERCCGVVEAERDTEQVHAPGPPSSRPMGLDDTTGRRILHVGDR